jgi:menaquinol-cytochrome c reductase cytochrome b/c subunit
MAASKLRREEHAQFVRYKDDVKREGKPFFPYAMWHDTLMSLVVVVVIIGLACVWYFTAKHAKDGVGILGPLYSAKADPGTTNFVPRPDWFFYFLFYLLRIFKWPNSVFIGTIGIPTVLLVLMIGLPFYDRRLERRPSRRPVAMVSAVLVIISMATLTWKGAIAKESLGSENVLFVPGWAATEGFADNPTAVAGAKIFAQVGCMNCHTYLGDGSSNFGAPDLGNEGTRGKGVDGLVAYISDPSKFGNNIMPSFADIGDSNLHKLAVFLDASKGPK